MSELKFVSKYENNKDEQVILLTLLRAYAVALQKKIQLPATTFLDEISGMLDISRSRARDIGDEFVKKEFKIAKFDLKKTEELYLGMYNATLNTGSVIDLQAIKRRVENLGFIEDTIDGVTIKPVKMTMRYGRFKKSYEYTSEYGSKNINQNKENTTLQFILKLKKGNVTKGASFNIYKSGRIRFSGGYIDGDISEPKSLVKYISKLYFNIDGRIPININNNTIDIKLGCSVLIYELYTILNSAGGVASFENSNITGTFEPERNKFIVKQRKHSPFLYVTLKNKNSNDKIVLVISKSGSVMIEGAKNVRETIQLVNKFLNALKESGLLVNPRVRNLKPKPKPTKLARRYNMKPAPDITRRGTSCPMVRRPNPYGFQGKCSQPKHYVRPNPQGQPCCYKIPRSTSYLQNKVKERFNRANIKIPANARKLFGFGNNTNNKANNVSRSNVNVEIIFNRRKGKNGINPVGLKINSRQCLRYSKVALVDIAKRKGLQLPKKTTKPIICDMLSKMIKTPSPPPAPKRKSKSPSPPKRKSKSPSPPKKKNKGKAPMRRSNTPSPNRPGPSQPKRRGNTPSPNRPGPSQPKRWGNTPSPNSSNSNNDNFSNIMDFARKLAR